MSTVSLIDSGRVWKTLAQTSKALACFEKAVNLCRPVAAFSSRASISLSQALDNKANTLLDLNRTDEAILTFDEAIQAYKNVKHRDLTANDVREANITVMNKGRGLMLQGNHLEAKKYLICSVRNFRKLKCARDLALALINLGDLYFRMKQWQKALTAFSESAATYRATTVFEDKISKSDYSYALFCMADTLLHLDRLIEAYKVSEEAITIQQAIANFTNHFKDKQELNDCLKLRNKILAKLNR